MDAVKINSKDAKRRNAILNGNLLLVFLQISVPLILLNLFTYIYGIIDTIVVADHGKNVLSSVVMVSQIKNLLSTLGGGLATGASIIVSRHIGRNDYESAKRDANTYITVSAVLAVVLVALILPFSGLILKLAQFTPELIEAGKGYFTVQIFTVGLDMFNKTFLGLEKSRGATRNVLYINLVVMTVKLIITVILVYGIGEFDTVWVAASTLFANLIITGYAIVQLVRKNYLFHYSIKNTSFKGITVKPYLRLSIPVFVGSFVFSLGKVIVNSLGEAHYQTGASGALGVSNNLSGAATTMTSSTEDSTSTIVSQNVGAGNTKRAVKTFWVSLAVNVAISIVAVCVLWIFTDPLVALFDGGDSEYHQLIRSIFVLERAGIIMLGVNAACMGFIYGLGYTKLSLVFNLSRLFVLRLPVLLICVYCFPQVGAVGLGYAMLISNVGVGIVSFVIATVCILKVKKHGIKDKL
jgi:putative MATE family efflux protein